MKTKILLSICLFLITTTGFSTIWTIVNTNYAFTPSAITIEQGDSVRFALGEIHNAVEVSSSTWEENGNTALSGGFETPYGGGLVLPDKLSVGMHYYVCAPHAAGGMKGTITVVSSNDVADIDAAGVFSVYPNPTHSLLSVKVSTTLPDAEYRITDLSGRIVATGLLSSEVTAVDMSGIAPGNYYFGITGLRSKTIKIIKY